jgi:protein involved in polysaccharide export with SLBB domain
MPTLKKKPSSVRTSLRIEPPTLEEAIYAAQGLTDDVDDQVEIAARLKGLPEAEVRTAILKAATTKPRISMRPPVQARVAAGRQPVVVERRAPRVLIR